MNFNNFTIKSQEAVQEAVNLVQSRGQQAIEPVHIMQGVMKASSSRGRQANRLPAESIRRRTVSKS